MGLFQRLAGTVASFFQIGGPAGPGINANGTALETKNAANSAFAIHRGATPVGDNDFATKAYVDEITKPFIVTAQANAPSALIANSGVEHYIVVSTAGTGAAAAYVAGSVLWDDGTGVGNVVVLGPTTGMVITTTGALTGGTFVFNANSQYVWTGATWLNLAPAVAGATYTIDFAIGTGASQSSVTSIPAGAIVLRAEVKITTPYSGGATIAVGQTGTTTLLQATGDNTPTIVNEYDADQRTGWGASALPVLVTVGGAPSAGVGTVTVMYASALA
jgi:hypothetical protein